MGRRRWSRPFTTPSPRSEVKDVNKDQAWFRDLQELQGKMSAQLTLANDVPLRDRAAVINDGFDHSTQEL